MCVCEIVFVLGSVYALYSYARWDVVVYHGKSSPGPLQPHCTPACGSRMETPLLLRLGVTCVVALCGNCPQHCIESLTRASASGFCNASRCAVACKYICDLFRCIYTNWWNGRLRQCISFVEVRLHGGGGALIPSPCLIPQIRRSQVAMFAPNCFESSRVDVFFPGEPTQAVMKSAAVAFPCCLLRCSMDW